MKIEPQHLNGQKPCMGGHFHSCRFCLRRRLQFPRLSSHGDQYQCLYVKAALEGKLYAEAREQAINPKLASYSVLITDDAGDTVAIFQEWFIARRSDHPDNYLAGGKER